MEEVEKQLVGLLVVSLNSWVLEVTTGSHEAVDLLEMNNQQLDEPIDTIQYEPGLATTAQGS